MIVRIVKMAFQPGKERQFLDIFEASREKIRASAGCSHLHLLRDQADPSLFFTYSHWESEAHLEAYRRSALFADVWGRVSPLFRQKAEAWSTRELD
jgi:quinol monooxygenase YgiN